MNRLPFFLIISGTMLYLGAQSWHGQFIKAQNHIYIERGTVPVTLQKVIAGPCQGLAADANILSVFTIYDLIRSRSLSPEQQKHAWKQLSGYLDAASQIDPWFKDTYRLSSGLLAFSPDGMNDAINILQRGSSARTWDWETPFLAGFIAHDRLHDDKMAFEFMKLAAQRPDAPPSAIRLASKFLNNESGIDVSIIFLEQMLKMLPERYHAPIKQRIKELGLESIQVKGK